MHDGNARRVAVLTGAGRGIGRALAVELGRLGHPVALQSRNPKDLEATAQAVAEVGGKSILVPGDVTSKEAADSLVSRAEAELGPVWIAVACAGQALSAPFLKTEAADLRRLLEVNVVAPFLLLRRAAEAMISHARGGRLVVVGSTASIKGMRYTAAYTASKHAVLGMVRSLALEVAPQKITANVLCPGWVDTPMFDQTLDNISQKTGRTRTEARVSIEKTIPTGQVLRPEEVAGLLRYLVSPEAGEVTGQAMVIDGGSAL
ncbi:MAG: SDR family oxidoreductase [Myxococcota bacterium]